MRAPAVAGVDSWLGPLAWFALLASLCGSTPTVAHGQALPLTEARRVQLADAWLQHLLEESELTDTFGRYVAAPSNVLLGAGMMSAPLWGDTRAPTDAAFITGGALMLTAGIGIWAHSDPDAAQLWSARFSSLGFVGMGTGLLLACADESTPCDGRRPGRHLSLAIAIVDTGMFLSWFVLTMVNPAPPVHALARSLPRVARAQHYDRVLDFLRRRERQRAIGAVVTLPWMLGFGAAWLGIAHEASTNTGRTALYGAGSVVIAVSVAMVAYQLLETRPSERMAAGRFPAAD